MKYELLIEKKNVFLNVVTEAEILTHIDDDEANGIIDGSIIVEDPKFICDGIIIGYKDFIQLFQSEKNVVIVAQRLGVYELTITKQNEIWLDDRVRGQKLSSNLIMKSKDILESEFVESILPITQKNLIKVEQELSDYIILASNQQIEIDKEILASTKVRNLFVYAIDATTSFELSGPVEFMYTAKKQINI